MAAAAPAVAQDAQSAGRIKVASGTAFVVRQGAVIPAEIGQLVFAADGLRTGADGRVGVTLKDETRISLGPNSEARLESVHRTRRPRANSPWCCGSCGVWRRTCRAGSRNSRPIRSDSRRPRRLWAFVARAWRSGSNRREQPTTAGRPARPGADARKRVCAPSGRGAARPGPGGVRPSTRRRWRILRPRDRFKPGQLRRTCQREGCDDRLRPPCAHRPSRR